MPKVLRDGVIALSIAFLTGAFFVTDAALAQGGFYAGGIRGYGYGLARPAYRAVAVAPGFGFGYGYYGHPLDDSYDYPFGYGEYAEYGPWAHRGFEGAGCELTPRRVRTASGWRWRTVRACY